MATKNTSLYDAPRFELWNEFSPYLQGELEALFCVVSSVNISLNTRTALLNVANRLGYRDSLCFITLNPKSTTQDAKDSPSKTLSGKNLFRVIETLDPLCLVSCDQETASLLATAYQCRIQLESNTTLLNRPFRGFVNLDKSLMQKEEKQKAWQLLKTLPSL